jgi:diaminohydroxyphosphoribosylaminopyrimidine deaminase/5-amino-6-(5-phosphoribosylamino)uracil reductase
MVEGGAHMARALIEADLVDEAAFFTAPVDLGEGGLSALAGLVLESVTHSAAFRRISSEPLGPDTLTVYERCR